MALGVLMVTLLLTGAAFQQGILSNSAATEDQRVKRAVQAADAGIDVARYRMGKIVPGSGPPCPVVDASGGGTSFVNYVSDGGESWCPEVSEDLGHGASYSYRVSAIAGGEQWIISTGTVDGVARRVAVRKSSTVASIFASYAAFSDNALKLNSNSQIRHENAGGLAHARSNAQVELNGSLICGNATPGPGSSVTGSTVGCGGSKTPAPAKQILPPVVVPPAGTVYDNGRLCNNGDTCSGDYSWSSSSRKLRVNSKASVTLTGNLYLFCEVSVDSESRLILAPSAGTSVRIYIGGPSECGTSVDDKKFILNSKSFVTGPGGLTNTRVSSPLLELFVVGDPTKNEPSKARVELNSESKILVPTGIYAPYSEVILNSKAELYGAVAAKRVDLNGDSSIFYTGAVGAIQSPTTAPTTADYRECAPSVGAGAPPGARC